MKKAVISCFVLAIVSFSYAYSQPSFPTNPNQAPIDGGLGLLAAAGGAYPYKKLREKDKEL